MDPEELGYLFDESGKARQTFSYDMQDRVYLERMLRFVLRHTSELVSDILATHERIRTRLGTPPPVVQQMYERLRAHLLDTARVLNLHGEEFILAARAMERPTDEELQTFTRAKTEWAEERMAGSSRIRKWWWARTMRSAQQRAEC